MQLKDQISIDIASESDYTTYIRHEKEPAMITIYQIRLSDSDIASVNANGWDSVPAAKARADMMISAKRWKDEFIEYYTPVYEVDTDDLEQAFESTNLWNDDKVRRLCRGSSSSVGDIFVKDGQYYIVDTFGFTAINNPEMEGMGND